MKSFKPGPKEKYKPKVHDKSIKELFKNGLFIEDFCQKHTICKKTYFSWVKKYPSFKKAAEIGKTYGEGAWARMPLKFQQKSFSYPYWSSIMKNKFGWGHVSSKKLKIEKNVSKRQEHIWNLVSSGKITIEHGKKLSELNLDSIKIYELTEMKQDIDAIKKKLGIKIK